MKKSLAGIGLLLLGLECLAATEQDKSSTAILLQGFHWNAANGSWYSNLESKAAEIQDLGVTHVWFPPPSNAASKQGYLPRELYNFYSAYGTEDQLRSVIASLRRLGIESVADIVINHRVGNWNQADFSNPTWDCRAVVNSDEWSGRCGGNDSGTSYGAARDIDHSQSFVQSDIKYWMGTLLRGLGFSGWRYDFVKGYGASYTKGYNDVAPPNFCVGEIWPDLNYERIDDHRQQLMNWIDGTQGSCGAFDFTSKGLLNKALTDNEFGWLRDSSGRPAGGIGWWPQKMVTFVDNHDTGPAESCGSGLNSWPVPCDKILLGYAYILSHPGIPTLYYPHVFDGSLKNNLKALITARRAVGIHSTSAVSIQKAERGLYAAVITGSQGRLAVKIGANEWNPGAGWSLVTAGSQFAIWSQSL